jgi:hypothetical protein
MSARMLRCFQAFVTLSLAIGYAACSETAGGPDYVQVGVAAGRSGAIVNPECTWMPVMPGGIVERELELNGGVGAWLHGTRDGVELKFSGIENPNEAARRFSHETLENGFAERIDVVTAAGDDFIVLVSSGCGSGVTL